MVRDVICFVGGAIGGFGTAYILLKKKYEIVVREEVAAAVEWAQNHNKTETKNNDEPAEEISHEAEVKEFNKIVDGIIEGGGNMDASKPYIIPEEDFVVDDDEYSKVSLDYYTDDGLYEGDEYIPNSNEVAGDDNLALLHGGPDDVIYVRNENFKIDYEICKIAGRFNNIT